MFLCEGEKLRFQCLSQVVQGFFYQEASKNLAGAPFRFCCLSESIKIFWMWVIMSILQNSHISCIKLLGSLQKAVQGTQKWCRSATPPPMTTPHHAGKLSWWARDQVGKLPQHPNTEVHFHQQETYEPVSPWMPVVPSGRGLRQIGFISPSQICGDMFHKYVRRFLNSPAIDQMASHTSPNRTGQAPCKKKQKVAKKNLMLKT